MLMMLLIHHMFAGILFAWVGNFGNRCCSQIIARILWRYAWQQGPRVAVCAIDLCSTSGGNDLPGISLRCPKGTTTRR